MTSRLYRLHGLVIRSDLYLPGAPAEGGPPDLVIGRGPEYAVSSEPPPGRIVAEARDGANRFYTAVAGEDGATVRFHGRCDFVFSASGREVAWHASPGMPDEVVAIMAAGTVLAFFLLHRGDLALHASAVRVGGRALAFVGDSGMGKSTLAALLCRHGASLVTDDVLRVDGTRCYPGATEVRLRPHAASLADAAATPRTTPDGRLALPLPHGGTDSVPLGAVVLPAVDKDGQVLVVARLPARDAVLAMAAFPRLKEWQDPASGRRHFERLVDLATQVPVWACRIPWGPPFGKTLPGDLLAAIGWSEPFDGLAQDALSAQAEGLWP